MIASRRGFSVSLVLIWFVMVAVLCGASIYTWVNDPSVVAIPLSVLAAMSVIAWLIFRRMYVVVSPRGVAVGVFRIAWVPWRTIAHFEYGELNAVYAVSATGERRVLCGVPFFPAFFDRVERRDRDVARVLARLDARKASELCENR